ncbi:Holliday junction branch migration protein RuvA [Candidatus Stoquefichus sp. SB1]|jgi:Holliday junction DNA helicase RuvA|uniref:Holliday junction branch migration protein RuvA n=1 Tax=Candidatus Stoquefichus sp. SB1 TaxID=1658109 RepID=UPI00067F3D6B|nr:Holliday junction branch migration protein RuvA [Candidatus Stoquefichus sp. SB1]
MYSYIKGVIVDMARDHIVIDNQGIGYLIYVSNPYQFTKGKETLVYVYQQVKEDGIVLYGFLTKEEKELFLKLILVKGIGCKTAIGILATGDVNAIIQAIESKNITYLKKIPGIGPKAAQQIILDLQGKFNAVMTEMVLTSVEFDEAIEVLIALGYKRQDVDKVMNSLSNEQLDTNGYVKKALSLLVKL